MTPNMGTESRRRARKASNDLSSSSGTLPFIDPAPASTSEPFPNNLQRTLSSSGHGWAHLKTLRARPRAFSSLPKLFSTGPRSRESIKPEPKRLPPLKRTNTVTRFLVYARLAKSFATNLENRREAIPPKEKLNRDFWKRAKVKVKREAVRDVVVPRGLRKAVYRTGKTWKLKATAFIGEPGRMEVIDKALSNVLNISNKKELAKEKDEDKEQNGFTHSDGTASDTTLMNKNALRIGKGDGTSLEAADRQEGQRSEARLLSFAQYQDELEATNSAIYGTGLTFNPSEYKAVREVQLSQETKAALRMEPEERTEEHLRLAVINLQQAVSAFSEYPTNIKHSLVRVGWYEKYETKRVIIRQGHRAENFYFIISGTAVVTLLVVDPSSGESYVRTAAFLGKGNSFGEIGLMHGSQRSATVTCKEDVELLAVRREDFVDIFMHIESDQEPDHIRFLRGLDILDGWPVNKIPWDDPKICLFTYFRRGTVMCKDSSQAEWIYFFKTGSCRVLMALRSTKPQPLIGSQPPSRRESKQSTPRQSYEGSKLSRLTQALHAPPPPHKSKGGKGAGKGLPPLHRRKQYEDYEDTEADLDEGNEHKKMILNLYKEKHPHTKVTGDDPMASTVERTLQPVVEDAPPPKPEMVFVELQKLGPKDTFGVSEAAFSGVMSSMAMSLVSDGAEAVLISRKFFIQHLSDEKRRQLRETVQPYPTEESLQQKLQDKTNWEAYKNSTIRQHVAYKQFVNDSLNW